MTPPTLQKSESRNPREECNGEKLKKYVYTRAGLGEGLLMGLSATAGFNGK